MNEEPTILPSFPLSQNTAPPFSLTVLFSKIESIIKKSEPLFKNTAPPIEAELLTNLEPTIDPFSFFDQPKAPALSVATLLAKIQSTTDPCTLLINTAPL